MRQLSVIRCLSAIGLAILTACAQPASTGIPTPDAAAQATAQAAADAAAAASAAATQAASAPPTMIPTMPPPTPEPPMPELPTPELPTPVPAAQPEPTLEPYPPDDDTPIPAAPKPAPRPPSPSRSSGVRCGVTIVHVVQPGQNLFRIALRYRTTINAIARLNGITNTRLIRAGQRLRVRTCLRGQSDQAPVAMGAAYTVRPDDTLSRIASRHGVSVAHIMAVNGLRATLIVAGQILIIA